MRIGLFLSIIAIAGCSDIQNDNNASKDSTTSNINSSKSAKRVVQTDFTKDSVFTIRFPEDSSSVTVTGKMTGINHPISVYIPITKGNLLTIILAPGDSTAKIRISQLFMPNGKADGPFGKNLRRKITQPGNYKVIIGENLMQGEEWKGDFLLTVKVE